MTETTYLWDAVSDNCLSESKAGNELIHTNEPGLFGSLLSQSDSTSDWFLHFDASGNTRNLSSHVSGATETYLYDAWGQFVSVPEPTVTSSLFGGTAGAHFG